MSFRIFVLLAALAAAFATSSTAHATPVTIGAEHNATIYAGAQTNSNGAGPGMFVGTNATPATSRALLQFDITDNVPAGATITGVKLSLTLGMVAGGGGGTGGGGGGGGAGPTSVNIDLHALTDSWGAGTTGSGNTSIGGTGAGFTANPGDATWTSRAFGTTLWTAAGGDYNSTVSATAAVGSTLNVGYNWGSTTQLVADVQKWLDTPSSNFGWILINQDETDAKTARVFYTLQESTASFQPALAITYTIPEPASCTLLVAGGLLSLVYFRQRRKPAR